MRQEGGWEYDYICLLCWLETKRVRWGDVCLCKDTIVMLARMGLSQLCLGHRVDRAVPLGIPDALQGMWSDTDALDDFVALCGATQTS